MPPRQLITTIPFRGYVRHFPRMIIHEIIENGITLCRCHWGHLFAVGSSRGGVVPMLPFLIISIRKRRHWRQNTAVAAACGLGAIRFPWELFSTVLQLFHALNFLILLLLQWCFRLRGAVWWVVNLIKETSVSLKSNLCRTVDVCPRSYLFWYLLAVDTCARRTPAGFGLLLRCFGLLLRCFVSVLEMCTVLQDG